MDHHTRAGRAEIDAEILSSVPRGARYFVTRGTVACAHDLDVAVVSASLKRLVARKLVVAKGERGERVYYRRAGK